MIDVKKKLSSDMASHKRTPIAPKKKVKANFVNLSAQIPPEIDSRLSSAAERSGLSKNLIARQAIIAALEMMERDGGLFLPLVFPEQGEVQG